MNKEEPATAEREVNIKVCGIRRRDWECAVKNIWGMSSILTCVALSCLL